MADEEEHRELQAAAVTADAAAQRCLLAGDRAGADSYLRVAEQRYRESWEAAPPGGYGRLVGMLKAAILRGDAAESAAYVLSALAFGTESPTAAYALALACLAAGDDTAARVGSRADGTWRRGVRAHGGGAGRTGTARRGRLRLGAARHPERLRGARPASHGRALRRHRARARAAGRGPRPRAAPGFAAPAES